MYNPNLKERLRNARGSSGLVEDNINSKLQKIKKDFERSQRDLSVNQKLGNMTERENQALRNMTQLPSGLSHIGRLGNDAQFLNSPSQATPNRLLSPGDSKMQAQKNQSMLTHKSPPGQRKLQKFRGPATLADVLRSPGSPRSPSNAQSGQQIKYTLSPTSSQLDAGVSEQLVDAQITFNNNPVLRALQASKVPNKDRLGATGETPDENRRIKYADKHRNVIQGVRKPLKSVSHLNPDKSEEARKKKATRVFGVDQQLYKDVDSDHQQRMLNSNIYIPDYDSAKDDTHHSTDNLTGKPHSNLLEPNNKSSALLGGSMNADNELYQKLYDRYQSSSISDQRNINILPQIYKKRNMDMNFNSHFKRRHLSVADTKQMLAKKSFAQSSPRVKGPIKPIPLEFASQLDHLDRSGGKIGTLDKNMQISTEANQLQRNESEAVGLQYQHSHAKISARISSGKAVPHLEKNSYNLRSQSVVHSSKKHLKPNKISLKEQTLMNSQSRVLQMLSKSSLQNLHQQDYDLKGGLSFDYNLPSGMHPSGVDIAPHTQKGTSAKLFNDEFDGMQSETKRKRVSKFKREKPKDTDARIDPRKIVLEMDLIDKTQIDDEQQSSVTNMKNRDPNALDASDKIEMTRRQLVLNELGIEIPRKPGSTEIDVKALFAIQLQKQDKDKEQEVNQYSPLKTEKATSSLITEIKPQYPLKSHFAVREDMTLDPQKNFYREVKKLLERKEDLTDFADLQRTEKQFLLKQGIFRFRLQNVNVSLDNRFSKASTSFLDESVLLDQFQDQIKEEENVHGKWLMALKSSDFDRKWLKMTNIKDHNGVCISQSGHLMTKEWLARQKKYKELQQNALNQRLQEIRENPNLDEVNKIRQSDLAVIKEDPDMVNSQENDDELDGGEENSDQDSEPGEEQRKRPSAINVGRTTNQDGRTMLDKKVTSNLDVSSIISGQTPGLPPGRQKFGDKTARSESTSFTMIQKAEQTEATYVPSSYTNKFKNKDKELYDELLRIEFRLFANPRTDRVIEQLGIVLSSQMKLTLAKIRNTGAHSTSNARLQLPQRVAQLMSVVKNHVAATIEKQRLNSRMDRERKEWDAEQEGIRGQELRVKMAKFLLERQQENDVLNYVIEKEANDSDEDFNVFDQLAQKVEEDALGQKLREDFSKKLVGEKARIVTDTAEEKIGYRIDPDQLDETLKKHADQPAPRLQFVGSPRSPLERSQKDFNKQVGSNYYDDNLQLNQAPQQNPLAMSIQREIAEMSQKVVLVSEEHQQAFKVYLKACYRKQCSPLPILNKIESGQSNALDPVLALEGYTVNETQVECLSDSLKFFGPSAFTKVYASNNGFKDLPRVMKDGSVKPSDTATFLRGVQQNKNIKSLEIAFNKITGPDSVKILCDMIAKERLTTLSLSSVKMSVPLSEHLFEAMTQSTKLQVLKLQNFKIEKEGAGLLGKAIGQQFSLHTLDLSWNQIAPRDFRLLIGLLKANKSLKDVSLHNMTARAVDEDVTDENGKVLPATSTSIASFITNSHSLLHLDLSYMSLSQEDVIEICTACGKARTLVAIHLTGNGQTQSHVAEVRDHPHETAGDDDYFRRQQGKVAFRSQLRQIMRPRRRLKQFRDHVEQENTYKTSKLIDNVPVLPRVKVVESEIKGKELKELEIVQEVSNLRGPDYDSAELKTVNQTEEALVAGQSNFSSAQQGEPKKATGQRGGATEEIDDDKLIFTRVLGHFEMPHAHRWAEVAHCWYCENHSYTLVLASKSICEKYYLRPLGKDAHKFKQKILDVAERHREVFQSNGQDEWGSDCDERYYDADAEEQDKAEAKGDATATKTGNQAPKRDDYYRNPQVVGAFSNWKRRSLMPIYDFLNRLRKNGDEPVRDIALGKDTYQQELHELKGNKAERVQRLDEARRTKTAKNLKVPQEIRETQCPWVDKPNQEDYICANQRAWDELIGLLPYKDNANIVVDRNLLKRMPVFNRDISETKEKIYAYAAFLPPGRFNSCVLHNCDEVQRDKGLYSFMIHSQKRDHPIDIRYKKVKKFKVERKFIKTQSMFADWIEPDYRKLLENDLRRTKSMDAFGIKGAETQAEIIKILHKNIEHFLDHFYYQLGHSSSYPASFYPHSYGLDVLKDQCQQLYLHDDNDLTLRNQELAYKATQGMHQERPPGAGKSICRFEFFEIFIRLATKKYFDSGKCGKADEAMQTFIDSHLKPGQGRYKYQGGMSFREKYVWTLGVDDMMKSNDASIQKLYNHFLDGSIDPETTQPYKQLNLAQCLAIGPHLGLTETDISEAYSFAKIIYPDEISNFNNYKKLKIVEFRDLLVRLADTAFKKQAGLSFNDKVSMALSALFRVIGCELAVGQHAIDVSSESDYNSDE